MKRRDLIRWLAAVPLFPSVWPSSRIDAARAAEPTRRVRPGEQGWPSHADWARLKEAVEGNLLSPASPLDVCRDSPGGADCVALFRELKNPYFIGDSPVLTQTCEWVGAWKAEPSAYVVAAKKAEHVAAAVDFARERNLRVVVRGGGRRWLAFRIGASRRASRATPRRRWRAKCGARRVDVDMSRSPATRAASFPPTQAPSACAAGTGARPDRVRGRSPDRTRRVLA